MCLRSSKDRIQASGAWDMGSIPIGGTTLRPSLHSELRVAFSHQ
ncbi:MAG: hypothetical protein QG603_629 [Patescibacteria group bacterium]|nr:hypothetical protein [Patescibacteria group bacterium]